MPFKDITPPPGEKISRSQTGLTVPAPDNWGELSADDQPDAVMRFKWGWNKTNGATVWEVGGPVDGLPAHNEVLLAAWGRMRKSTRCGRACTTVH